MKKNIQGYALPLALIVVAIFSIFVANISLDADNRIQNHIIEKYQNLNKQNLADLAILGPIVPLTITTSEVRFLVGGATYTYTINSQKNSDSD
jgi:hypothetical protein